jgi:DNA-binding MarR family transcriptional regulator
MPAPSRSAPHIGQLLRDAFAEFERELLDGMRAAGFDDVRPKYNAVLRHLDERGTRASELARRAGLTRQALTQIVDELEAAGYVERRPDPGDRRAKLVVYTEAGRRGFRDSRTVIATIERRWRSRLGRARFAELSGALAELARN